MGNNNSKRGTSNSDLSDVIYNIIGSFEIECCKNLGYGININNITIPIIQEILNKKLKKIKLLKDKDSRKYMKNIIKYLIYVGYKISGISSNYGGKCIKQRYEQVKNDITEFCMSEKISLDIGNYPYIDYDGIKKLINGIDYSIPGTPLEYDKTPDVPYAKQVPEIDHKNTYISIFSTQRTLLYENGFSNNNYEKYYMHFCGDDHSAFVNIINHILNNSVYTKCNNIIFILEETFAKRAEIIISYIISKMEFRKTFQILIMPSPNKLTEKIKQMECFALYRDFQQVTSTEYLISGESSKDCKYSLKFN